MYSTMILNTHFMWDEYPALWDKTWVSSMLVTLEWFTVQPATTSCMRLIEERPNEHTYYHTDMSFVLKKVCNKCWLLCNDNKDYNGSLKFNLLYFSLCALKH